jgi:hypothetical protein
VELVWGTGYGYGLGVGAIKGFDWMDEIGRNMAKGEKNLPAKKKKKDHGIGKNWCN